MSINSPTGILDVTNATIRAGKLESTGDITCSSNLVVSGGFDLSAINSNADTVVDFTATRQLRKYPREILTSDSQNGYTVTASENTNTSKHRAFNEDTYGTNERWVSQWVSGTGGRYDRTTGFYDGATYDDCLSTSSGTPEGEWLAIQVPEAFVLHSFEIVANSATNSMDDPIARGQAPRDFQVWGSNDGTAWTKVFKIEDADAPSGVRDGRTFYTSGVTTTAYNRYALIVTRNGATYPNATQWADVVTVGELRYYGYGQDGDGQDVRLRSHANAPNTDFLEVHFDANVVGSYPGNGTTLTDVSGEAHHATLNNGVGFDSTYGALTFNGSNQNVNTQALGISGDFVHTASLWVKPTVNQSALSATDWSAFFYIGQETYADEQTIAISYRKDELRYWFGGNDVDVTTDFKANEWVHIAVVYRGGGGTAVNRDVYVNGVKQRYLRTFGSSYGNVLNVQSTGFLRLGASHGTNAAPADDFNGSIANFRLYTRPLIEAEIHQLYDWEKVRFGRVALGDVVAFRDGSLGVGVAEPSRDDRLVVDGRAKADSVKTPVVVDRNDVVVYEQTGPHDRPLVKYPEIAMTASTVGGYTVSEPTNTFHSNSSFRLWKAFNNDTGTPNWETFGGSYDTGTRDPQTSGSYAVTTVVSGTTYYGVYAQMLAPIGVKVSHVDIRPQNTYGLERLPGIAVFAGSDDGTEWTLIRSVTNNSGALNAYTRYNVNATQAYKYIRIIWNKLTSAGTTTSFRDRAAASEIKIYGYEEGDVSTDSTWTSVLNKPGTQHLEVYWDGADSNSYPGAGTEVFDLSGNGVKGTITGNNGFDSTTYNAWTFDGSGDYISTTSSGLGTGGAFDHSFAFWFKINRNITNNDYVVTFGEEALDNMIAVNISGNSLIHFDNWGRGVITGDIVRLGIWYHVACTHTGSATGNVDTQLIYVNGNRQVTNVTGTGTLAFTSNRITIGARPGTNNSNTPEAFLDGAVANVRFYKGKVLNADQVRELYEYDAVRFGHRASNSVTIYKGNLGLGVTEPTSRLEIAGDERIQEYPPRAMTGYETYIEGHGVFRASQSSPYPASNYNAWKVFDKSLAYGAHFLDSYSSTNDYIYDGAGTRSDGLGRIAGEWVKLEMPYAINLKSFAIAPASLGRAPEDFVILGSNDDTLWTQLANFNGLGSSDWSYSGGQYLLKDFTVPNTKTHYKYFAIVVTRTESNDYLQIDAMVYYGTPAPSSLEDGHLTLGKALTLPRVSGHPAGAETPRAESLVVHYDTTVDSVVSGSTVVDISGEGNNGTLTNGAAYSSTDRAFTFDGTNDRITTTAPFSAGDNTFSVSFWVKRNLNGTVYCPIFIGDTATGEGIGMDIYGNGNVYWFVYGGKFLLWPGVTSTWFPVGSWTHVVVSHTAGTDFANLNKVWINGVEMSGSATFGGTALDLSLDANDGVTLGASPYGNHLNGSISNFKLYDAVVTAEEVAMEYALGRTGKSLNLTDTSLCLGGAVPRAQLDVRGSARFDGKLAIGYYGSSDKEALAPLDVRGDYIQSSANGTVSTAARFSSSDGTLHVSSIKTSNGAETLALQTTIDNKTMDYNIENSWSYGTDARHALCLQPYKGRVGVRVTSPSYPLHVAGSAGNMPTMKYFNSGSTSLASGGNDAITIYAAGNIYASGLVAASDERIKKEIVDADDAECLETLRLLNPKKYRYKDEINRGQEPVWGFIAQEVRETLPYATRLSRQTIPNIYELANVSSSNVITFTNFNTSDLEANATTVQVQTVADMEESVTIAEIIDEHAIRVEEDLSNWTGSVDETGNVVAGNQLFVYGQKMDDFVLLKKDAIWTVATAALQEVDRQQQADKLRIAELETQLASVLARLDAFTAPDAEFPELKTRLQTIETQANSAIQILSEFGVSGLMDPIDTSTWPAEATLAVLDARLKPIETGATGARAILDLFGVDGLPEFTVDETDTIESRISALESAGRTAQKTLQDFGVDI